MSSLIAVPLLALNLTIPSQVYDELDRVDQEQQMEINKRANVRSYGGKYVAPARSRVQIKDNGMKHSATNVTVGFPI